MATIRSLLISNRGEIAARVIRSARACNVRTIAVYSEADAHLPYVAAADQAVCIGPAEAARSYLSVERILDAAARTGADAIHPGYGFLSEDATFARAVVDAGLVWVGPPPDAIATMGNKAVARKLAAEHGLPLLPGYDGDDDDAALIAAARAVGAPLLVKAAAGGGGRGMRRVDDLSTLPSALVSARREAKGAFGDGRLILERYVERARHVEVQVFGDTHGNLVHVGERECSIQRRHQKVIEEAPAPNLTPATRAAMHEVALRFARALDYASAGTVEFVVDERGAFYFLEMNTRIQVEHPVTEAVYDLDLVALQLAVADGRALPMSQEAIDSRQRGVAIEARIYAEDPVRDYAPGTGKLIRFELPEPPLVRADAGYRRGDVVGAFYDAMLAKLIVHAEDRPTAVRALGRALDACWVAGVANNLPLLRDIAADDAFASGQLSTSFLAERGLPRPPPMDLSAALALAAVWEWTQACASAVRPEVARGWRLTGSARLRSSWVFGEAVYAVELADLGAGRLQVYAGDEQVAIDVIAWDDGGATLLRAGIRDSVRWAYAPESDEEAGTLYMHLGVGEAMLRRLPRTPAPRPAATEPGSCEAPSAGIVRVVHVDVGDVVAPGAPLVVLEAMKMETTLHAPEAGRVAHVACAVGDVVADGALLVQIEPQRA